MRKSLFVATVVGVVFAANLVHADLVGTYVEATTSNTDNALSPGSAWGTPDDNGGDGLWQVYQGWPNSSHQSYEVYYDGNHMTAYHETESAPMLATTISGLTPGGSYAIRLLFGSHTDVGNQIQGGLSSSALTLYNHNNSAISDAGVLNFEDGVVNRYQALLGTAVANASGQVTAYIASAPDMKDGGQFYGRVMYDGLSYQAVPEPTGMAMVVSVVFGLLAYAWRKRK